MDRSGRWSLSPAFDVTYSYNPSGRWTGAHQMTLNGSATVSRPADLLACARTAAIKRRRAIEILQHVQHAVSRWHEFAEQAQVPHKTARRIAAAHRTNLLS